MTRLLPQVFAVFDCAPDYRSPFCENRYGFYKRLSSHDEPIRVELISDMPPFTIHEMTPAQYQLVRNDVADRVDPSFTQTNTPLETQWWLIGLMLEFSDRPSIPIVDFLHRSQLRLVFNQTATNDESSLCMVRQIYQRSLRDSIQERAHKKAIFAFRPVEVSTSGPPTFVLQALLRDATAQAQTCPITCLTPSECKTVLFTNCFHWFEKGALERWFEQKTSCPVCKAPVSSTKSITL